MKNIFLKSTLFSLTLLFFSCSENETLVDFVQDNVGSGGILRTLDVNTDIEYNDPSIVLTYLLEVQDNENGDLSDRVEVYAGFVDNENNGQNDKEEVLIATIPNSEFILGERLPRISFEISISELENALSMSTTDYTGGDVFPIRFELVFKDGRRWSNYNASQTLLGNQFFASPFLYNSNVVCPFNDQSLAGEHTFITTNMYVPGSDPCGGTVTGSVIWGETNTEGSYTTSDFSFGLFESSCWDDGPATSTSARVIWFCSNLNTGGADQYGENWTYEIISVIGPVMVIEFVSSYQTGEGGITTLTRAGGENWPLIFQD